MPIDYSKSKIYKLTTINDPDLVYYGSTVNSLNKRKTDHKSAFKTEKLKCTSCKLFELGIDDVEITLIENVNCNSKEELLKRERFYIENNNCINKIIPIITNQEYKEYQELYREQNIYKINEHSKHYYEKNKDKILNKQKEYNKQNKNKIKSYQKEYMKEYSEQNKYKLKDYRKEYNKKNDDKIKQYQKEYRKQNKEKKIFIILK
jgi:hypothetical protein